MTNMPPPIAYTKHFLSRIPGRHPVDKLHASVGHAKSAVNNYFNGYKGYGAVPTKPAEAKRVQEKVWSHTGPDMEIYELVDGAWKLLYQIRRGDEELPWKRGELLHYRAQIEAELTYRHDKLSREALELAAKSFNQSRYADPLHGDAESIYLLAYEDGYRAAKSENNRNGS